MYNYLNMIVLFIVCFVVFIRPVWGIPILILVTSTLFHLSQYMTIPLPTGYIEPTECILFTLCVRLFFWKYAQNNEELDIGVGSIETPEGLSVKRVLLSAIIPYILWQSFVVFLGTLNPMELDHFRFTIRFFLNGIFPWTIVWILWKLRRHKDEIITIVALINILTAIAHITLQVFDHRSLMSLAYWQLPTSEYEFIYESRMRWLESDGFVRGLPQGIVLMLFFSVYFFSKYLVSANNRKTAFMFSMICFTALAITFTRSLIFSAISGCLIAIILAYYFRVMEVSVKIRALKWLTCLVLAVCIYGFVNPAFLDLWQERVEALQTGTDAKIFSEENVVRGLDNIASIDAVVDRPFWGYGSPRYPSSYSYRLGPATDIHPLLQIGLVGGIPAILLLLRLLFLLIWKFGLRTTGERYTIIHNLPHVAVLIMLTVVVNIIGAGGTLYGTGLIAMALFIGLMVANYSDDKSLQGGESG